MPAIVPLTMREMRVMGRRKAFYVLRSAVAILGIIVLFIAGTYALQQLRDAETAGWTYNSYAVAQLEESLAKTFAGMVLLFQLVVVFFFTPFAASGLIARERLDGTLPLLTLARVRGGDIWSAKFVAAFGLCELLLLSTLPIAASASFFGGIPVGSTVVQIAVLSCIMAVLCAMSLAFSARSTSPNQALVLSLCVSTVFVCIAVPQIPRCVWGLLLAKESYERHALLWIALVDISASDAGFGSGRLTLLGHGMENVAYVVWLTVTWVLAAALVASRAIMQAPRCATVRSPRRPRTRPKTSFPMVHLIVAGSLPPRLTNGRMTLFSIGTVLLMVGLLPYGIGWVAIVAALCYTSASAMDALRNNKAMDEVASTSVSDLDLAQAVVGVNLSRAKLCAIPLMVSGIFLAQFALRSSLLIRQLGHHGAWFSVDGFTWLMAYGLGMGIVAVLLALQALCAVSIASVFRASGLNLPLAAAASVACSIALFAGSMVLPWYVAFKVQQGRAVQLFGSESAVYFGSTLALLWSVTFAGALGYISLRILAKCVRGGWTWRQIGARAPSVSCLGWSR